LDTEQTKCAGSSKINLKSLKASLDTNVYRV
jgi:hypothetical protein